MTKATTIVQGSLSAAASTTFRIEFFVNSSDSGFQDSYLGFTSATTDGSGDVVFLTTLSAAIPIGRAVYPTATDPDGNTSETSPLATVTQSFLVTNTSDSGVGSLRQAIVDANAANGGEIDFEISGGGQHVIETTGLPDITAPVFINGASQPNPDSTTGPLICIDGEAAAATFGLALDWGSDGSVISGLELNGFTIGVFVFSSHNTIGGTAAGAGNVIAGTTAGVSITGATATANLVQGNLIGVGSAGLIEPNNTFGVYLGEGAHGNSIGGTATGAGNVIVSPTYSVYLTSGASENSVQGNRIGTDLEGMEALGGPTSYGVVLSNASDNTIGGPGAAGNLIEGGSIGVYIVGSGATGNVVEGNLVGTDATGTQAITGTVPAGLTSPARQFMSGSIAGPTEDPLAFPDAASLPTLDFSSVQQFLQTIAEHWNIGDPLPNVLPPDSGMIPIPEFNSPSGSSISPSPQTGAGGLSAMEGGLTEYVANAWGVVIRDGASANTIGGTAAGTRNVISGKSDAGVLLAGAGTMGNVIAGNSIGVDITGMWLLSNGDGIRLEDGASSNTIGGTTAGAGNVIANNDGAGVIVGSDATDSTTIGNRILGNSIYANAALGIDLGHDGPTANSAGSPHTGPNRYQNSPVLTSVVSTATTTAIQGTLDGAPNATYRIEVFSGPSGSLAELVTRQTFLGFQEVTTDGDGHAGFTAVVGAVPWQDHLVTATATDPAGNTSEFALGILARNVPVVSDDLYSVVHDQVLTTAPFDGVLGNDDDYLGNTLSASLVTSVQHGTLAFHADGSFIYTPAAGFSGIDRFTYQASDGALAGNVATVTIAVTQSAPVAAADTYRVGHDRTLSVEVTTGVLANDSDADLDPFSASLVADVQHGSLTLLGDGSFTYTPASGFVGTDSFTYRAGDGLLTSGVTTVTIAVDESAPVASDQAPSMAHDRELNGSVHVTDADGDALTFQVVATAQHGTLEFEADGSFTYTPDAHFAGSDRFTYQAGDGLRTSNVATVTIAVAESAPIALSASPSMAHDRTLNSSVFAIDADNDARTFTAVDLPQHGTLTFHADGTFAYTPAPGFSGTDRFTYQAGDGWLTSNLATVAIAVTESAPLAAADLVTVAYNRTLVVDSEHSVLDNDSDADFDSLTAVLVAGAQHGTLSFHADGTFTYTPDAGFDGTDSFTYRADDGRLTSDVATVTIDVSKSVPFARADLYTMGHDRTLSAPSVLGNDSNADGDAVTPSLVTNVQHGSLTFHADGTFSYTPFAGFSGTDRFSYRSTDGTLTGNEADVVIGVNENAPIAFGALQTVPHDQTLNSAAWASDPESDSLSYTLVAQAQHGTLTFHADGTFTYVPAAGFSGSDSFTYRASDGYLLSNVATYAIEITESAPVAANDSYVIAHDQELEPDSYSGVLSNDRDADFDDLTVSLVANVQHGTLALNADGSFSYTPNAGYSGSDRFTYRAGDGLLTSNVATVAITVTGTAAITAWGDQYTVAHDRTLNVAWYSGVLLNDATSGEDPLTPTLVADVQHGTLSLEDDGSFVYTPDEGFSGTDTFTYQATDGASTSDVVAVTIAVAEGAPVARADRYTTVHDQALVVQPYFGGLLDNDHDPDSDLLSATLVSDVQQGSLDFGGDGSFTYTPDSGFSGTDKFTYHVSDGTLTSETVTVTIAVAQGAPIATADVYTVAYNQSLSVSSSGSGALGNDHDPDGDSLAAVLVVDAQHGSLSFNADGTFDYTPDAGFWGTDSFTYRAEDGLLSSAEATVTIDVSRSAPFAVADLYTMAHDRTLTTASWNGVLTNDTNADGDPVTAFVVSSVQHGTVTFHADGSFTYTPDAGFSGTDTFVYQSTDGTLTGNEVDVVIAVTQSAPIAADDAYTIAHDQTLTVDSYESGMILVNDSDSDGDALTAVLVAGVQHGTLTFHSDGSFAYVPNAGYSGPDSFTYRSSDGTLQSHVATVSITVTESAPIATNDAYAIAHDRTLTTASWNGVLANDSDADGDARTVSVVDGVQHGTLTFQPDGSFTYVPSAGFSGTDRFTYVADDGRFPSNLATVTIAVTEAAPGAVSDSYSIGHDRTLSAGFFGGLLTNDLDDDGDTMTATLVADVAHGTLSLQPNGSFTYTPADGFWGADSFTYRAGDGRQSSDVTTVTIALTETAPTAASHLDAIGHDRTLAGDLQSGVPALVADADGDALTVSLVAGVLHGVLTLDPDGHFSYTPDAGFAGTDSFSYQASDGLLASGAATVVIEVGESAPLPANDTYTIGRGRTLTVTASPFDGAGGVLGNDLDADEDALTASLVVGAAHGSLDFHSDGSFTYTPAVGFVGTDRFTYQASDGLLSRVAVVWIEVTEVAPIALDDSYRTAHDQALELAPSFGAGGILFNDSNLTGVPLTAVLVTGAAHGTVTLNPDGTFTYSPAAGFIGTDHFTYRADDGILHSNVATVTIEVTNTAPTTTDDSYSARHDRPLTIPFGGVLTDDTDLEGDTLTATLVSNVAHGTLTFNANGTFTYTPTAGFVGTDSFTYCASDGRLTSNVATVTISVPDTAPEAVDDEYEARAGHVREVTAGGVLDNDTDAEYDHLTAVLVTGPQHGTLTLNADGTFTYTPAGGFSGTDTFTYRAGDGALTSDVATVTLTVVPETAPLATVDVYSIAPGFTLTVTTGGVLANDSDANGDPLTAVLVGDVQHGTLTLQASGSFTYTPAAGFSGTDTFTYQASDGTLSSGVTTVTIDVGAPRPQADADTYTVAPGHTLTVDDLEGVLANDIDVDLDPLTAMLVATTGHGTLTLDPDGGFQYVPAPGFTGTDTFTYRASDGTLQSDVTTVTITVANQPPIAGDDSYSVTSGQTLLSSISDGLLANDRSPVGDPITAVLVSSPQHGTLSLQASGLFSYTPASGFVGTDTFTYRAIDGTLTSDVATVTITVTEASPTSPSNPSGPPPGTGGPGSLGAGFGGLNMPAAGAFGGFHGSGSFAVNTAGSLFHGDGSFWADEFEPFTLSPYPNSIPAFHMAGASLWPVGPVYGGDPGILFAFRGAPEQLSGMGTFTVETGPPGTTTKTLVVDSNGYHGTRTEVIGTTWQMIAPISDEINGTLTVDIQTDSRTVHAVYSFTVSMTVSLADGVYHNIETASSEYSGTHFDGDTSESYSASFTSSTEETVTHDNGMTLTEGTSSWSNTYSSEWSGPDPGTSGSLSGTQTWSSAGSTTESPSSAPLSAGESTWVETQRRKNSTSGEGYRFADSTQLNFNSHRVEEYGFGLNNVFEVTSLVYSGISTAESSSTSSSTYGAGANHGSETTTTKSKFENHYEGSDGTTVSIGSLGSASWSDADRNERYTSSDEVEVRGEDTFSNGLGNASESYSLSKTSSQGYELSYVGHTSLIQSVQPGNSNYAAAHSTTMSGNTVITQSTSVQGSQSSPGGSEHYSQARGAELAYSEEWSDGPDGSTTSIAEHGTNFEQTSVRGAGRYDQAGSNAGSENYFQDSATFGQLRGWNVDAHLPDGTLVKSEGSSSRSQTTSVSYGVQATDPTVTAVTHPMPGETDTVRTATTRAWGGSSSLNSSDQTATTIIGSTSTTTDGHSETGKDFAYSEERINQTLVATFLDPDSGTIQEKTGTVRDSSRRTSSDQYTNSASHSTVASGAGNPTQTTITSHADSGADSTIYDHWVSTVEDELTIDPSLSSVRSSTITETESRTDTSSDEYSHDSFGVSSIGWGETISDTSIEKGTIQDSVTRDDGTTASSTRTYTDQETSFEQTTDELVATLAGGVSTRTDSHSESFSDSDTYTETSSALVSAADGTSASTSTTSRDQSTSVGQLSDRTVTTVDGHDTTWTTSHNDSGADEDTFSQTEATTASSTTSLGETNLESTGSTTHGYSIDQYSDQSNATTITSISSGVTVTTKSGSDSGWDSDSYSDGETDSLSMSSSDGLGSAGSSEQSEHGPSSSTYSHTFSSTESVSGGVTISASLSDLESHSSTESSFGEESDENTATLSGGEIFSTSDSGTWQETFHDQDSDDTVTTISEGVTLTTTTHSDGGSGYTSDSTYEANSDSLTRSTGEVFTSSATDSQVDISNSQYNHDSVSVTTITDSGGVTTTTMTLTECGSDSETDTADGTHWQSTSSSVSGTETISDSYSDQDTSSDQYSDHAEFESWVDDELTIWLTNTESETQTGTATTSHTNQHSDVTSAPLSTTSLTREESNGSTVHTTDQTDIDANLDDGPIHVVEGQTFIKDSTDWSSASSTQTYSNTITPEDGGTETVSGTITTVANSTGSKLHSTHKTINGRGSQATTTEQTSEIDSSSSGRTITDEGTYTFSGIPEDGVEYSGSGSFLETDTSSETTSFRFNSKLVTDANGNETGIERTTQTEIDTWDYVRTDTEYVSTGESPAIEVDLISEYSGTKTLRDVAKVYLSDGSEIDEDVATSDGHSSTTLSEDGSESDTNVGSDDFVSNSLTRTGPKAITKQASGETVAQMSEGTRTGRLAAARAAVPSTSAAASGQSTPAASNTQILLNGDLQKIPASTVQGLINEGKATLYEKDETGAKIVYFADVAGDRYLVMFLQSYKENGQEFYKVAFLKSVPVVSPTENIERMVSGLRRPRTQVLYYDAFKIQPNLQKAADLLEKGLTGALHVVPFGALIDNAQQGNYGEAALSAVGDAALILGSVARLSGLARTARGAAIARNLTIAAVGIDGALGLTRLGQGFFAISTDDKDNKAVGYFGEGLLRLLGASVSSLRLIREAKANALKQSLSRADGSLKISEAVGADTAIAAGPITLLGKGDPLAVAAKWIKPQKGVIDVIVHGTSDSFWVLQNGVWVQRSHRILAKLIEKSGESGESIRLISCSSGASPTAVAKNLANKLGMKVVAPNDKLWIHADGSMTIGKTSWANTGQWVTFQPGRP